MITHLVIPVRDNQHLTKAITTQLQKEGGWDRCWVIDNGSKDNTARYLEKLATRDPRFTRIYRPTDTIHQLWDEGFRHARGDGAELVGFLNNDIELAPGTLVRLAQPFEELPLIGVTYPDYDQPWDVGVNDPADRSDLTDRHGHLTRRFTSGTYRHGGMCGYAFMVRGEAVDWVPALPLIDPQFAFWYGDDDLAFNLEKRGWKQVRVVGLPIRHVGGATSALHPEVLQSVGDDGVHCARKWGR